MNLAFYTTNARYLKIMEVYKNEISIKRHSNISNSNYFNIYNI